MSISKRELKTVNSPIRKLIQKYQKFSVFNYFLKRRSISLKGKKILEVGCGAGYGLEIIDRSYNPSKLVGFDILPEEVKQAKQKRTSATIFLGEVTSIDLPPNSFDAVFISAVLHHVPKWVEGLKEIHRVLTPRGVLLISEPLKSWIDLLEKYLKMSHPKEARFDQDDLLKALRNTGFKIIEKRILFNQSGYFMCVKPGFPTPPTSKAMEGMI